MTNRDLNLILDAYEKGEPFYLYTGRFVLRIQLSIEVPRREVFIWVT